MYIRGGGRCVCVCVCVCVCACAGEGGGGDIYFKWIPKISNISKKWPYFN